MPHLWASINHFLSVREGESQTEERPASTSVSVHDFYDAWLIWPYGLLQLRERLCKICDMHLFMRLHGETCRSNCEQSLLINHQVI